MFTDVTKVLAVLIVRVVALKMEAANIPEISTRLHGAKARKTTIFD
jgi:hypothetical protein